MVLAAATLPAQAQRSYSVEELVDVLKPRPGGPSRGIRQVSPAADPVPQAVPAFAPSTRPARPPAAPRATAPDLAPTAGAPSADLTVQFETGSDRLTPAAVATLDVLGRALSNPQLSNYTFRIVGHTDATGNRDANQVLSDRRAAAVAAFVSSRYGVEARRLTAMGMGQSEPLVPTPPGVAEARNRRVQIINMGPQ